MRPMARWRTSVTAVCSSGLSRSMRAGVCSVRSAASRCAACDRKSGLAKFDDLPRQTPIGLGCAGAAGIRGHRLARQRRFPEAYGLPHDGVEDVVVAQLSELREHVPGEVGASVVEGGQDAQDAQARVETLGAD